MEENIDLEKFFSFSDVANIELETLPNDLQEKADLKPAPLPEIYKDNKDSKQLNKLQEPLFNCLQQCNKKLINTGHDIITAMHSNDAKILTVNALEDKYKASVYLTFQQHNKNILTTDWIKKAMEYAKTNTKHFEINRPYLDAIKSIFVDRKGIQDYNQGGGDDELILNSDTRKLKELKFYQKPEGYPLELQGKYNMFMVAKYEKTNDNKKQEMEYCIIDLDNNLLISNDQLKLYWHNMDKNKNSCFDNEEYPVYISGEKWFAFRINNILKNEHFQDAQANILFNGQKMFQISELCSKNQEQLRQNIDRANENDTEASCYNNVGNVIKYWMIDLFEQAVSYQNQINVTNTLTGLYRNFIQIQKNLLLSFSDDKEKKLQSSLFITPCLNKDKTSCNHRRGDYCDIMDFSNKHGGDRLQIEQFKRTFKNTNIKEFFKKIKENELTINELMCKFVEFITDKVVEVTTEKAKDIKNNPQLETVNNKKREESQTDNVNPIITNNDNQRTIPLLSNRIKDTRDKGKEGKESKTDNVNPIITNNNNEPVINQPLTGIKVQRDKGEEEKKGVCHTCNRCVNCNLNNPFNCCGY